jgi:hypothetical protein
MHQLLPFLNIVSERSWSNWLTEILNFTTRSPKSFCRITALPLRHCGARHAGQGVLEAQIQSSQSEGVTNVESMSNTARATATCAMKSAHSILVRVFGWLPGLLPRMIPLIVGDLEEEVYEFLSRTPEGHSVNVVRTLTMWSCCDEDEWTPGCATAPAHQIEESDREL